MRILQARTDAKLGVQLPDARGEPANTTKAGPDSTPLRDTAGRYQARRFRKAQCPIVERLVNSMMMHGRNDRLVPFAHTEALFAAHPGPKELYVDDSEHHDGLPPEFLAKVKEFLRRN